MKPDGSIRIDTKIDQSGAKRGLNALGGQLKGFGAAIKAAFATVAVMAFTKFVKDSVTAAKTLQNALIGLRSIAEGQGKSFTQAKSFIDDYISDGLVPAADAVTAYKNLLMRGYSTDQIEKVMTALKNSAAFGKSAALTMGQAVSSATEGLRNENSILVDNAGVTKNVSMMWADYAKSIGVGVNSLTKAQKIQAEVNGIMTETRFQTGDAAKLVNTFSGQTSKLTFLFTQLKTTLGGAFMQILTPVLKTINQILVGLNEVATKFASLVTLLTGQSQEVATTATDGAEAIDGLTDSTTEAGKAAKGLAGFDTLNVLKEGSVSTAAAATPSDTAVPTTPADITETETAIGGVAKKILDFIKQLKDDFNPAFEAAKKAVDGLSEVLDPLKEFAAKGLEDFYNSFLKPIGTWAIGDAFPRFVQITKDLAASIDFSKINGALKRLWDAIVPFAKNVGDGLLWFYKNVLSPLGTWVANDLAPAFLDLLSAAITAVSSVIDALKPFGQWLFDSFLRPLAEWTGGIIVSVIEGLTQKLNEFSNWARNNQETVEQIAKLLLSFFAGIWVYNTTKSLIVFFTALIPKLTSFGTALAAIFTPTAMAALAVGALAAGIVYLALNWDKLTPAQRAITILGALAAAALAAAVAIALFHTSWTMGIAAAGIVAGIALLAGTYLFSSGAKLPSTGGGSMDAASSLAGSNFSASALPHLAQGAVIPPNRQFMAVLGDQRHGTNIEAPLDTIKQGVAEVLAGMGGSGGDTKVTIKFAGSNAQIGRALQPIVTAETTRRGPKLIKGVT